MNRLEFTEITPPLVFGQEKQELGVFLTKKIPGLEDPLKIIFEEAVRNVETIYPIKISNNLKEKIWEKISLDKMKVLNETLVKEFENHILSKLQERDFQLMLQQHQRKNTMNFAPYGSQFSQIFRESRLPILNAILKKSSSMLQELTQEIISLINEKDDSPLPATENNNLPRS